MRVSCEYRDRYTSNVIFAAPTQCCNYCLLTHCITLCVVSYRLCVCKCVCACSITLCAVSYIETDDLRVLARGTADSSHSHTVLQCDY